MAQPPPPPWDGQQPPFAGGPAFQPAQSSTAPLDPYGYQQQMPQPTLQLQSLQPQPMQQARPLVIIPLCRKGDRAGIEKQLQAGATVNETDNEGNTPLHVAVEAPKNEIATVQCLLESGASANAVNYIGASPLHYVCLRKSNHRGVANILLENGANINHQTVAGKSALHFACENQLPELVEVLSLFAADTNQVDHEGNTPMHLALIHAGQRDTVKRQIIEHLIAYHAVVQAVNFQSIVPLHLCCSNGYIRCAQLLMDRQADVTAVNARHQTCLHLACIGGHAEITQLLVQVMPQSIDMADIEGNTPLHMCATVGNLDCALLLLKMDANTNLKNVQKKTAFDVAKIRGTDLNNTHNPELVQVLKDAKKGGTCRQS